MAVTDIAAIQSAETAIQVLASPRRQFIRLATLLGIPDATLLQKLPFYNPLCNLTFGARERISLYES